ncbi:hypothetical protein FQN49_003707 [Arthroderma sp. PD_2]|nr:hypothetical protein FQN49_003707 [Arthroderma sp. PD_2]
MGGICSKSSNPADPFAQPGRVLGAQPTPATTAPANTNTPLLRKNEPPKSRATAGRTLGGGGSVDGTSSNNARSAAAQAAEERAAKLSAAAGKGKLSSQLAAQKSKSRSETLGDMSREERAARDVQSAEETRKWN